MKRYRIGGQSDRPTGNDTTNSPESKEESLLLHTANDRAAARLAVSALIQAERGPNSLSLRSPTASSALAGADLMRNNPALQQNALLRSASEQQGLAAAQHVHNQQFMLDSLRLRQNNLQLQLLMGGQRPLAATAATSYPYAAAHFTRRDLTELMLGGPPAVAAAAAPATQIQREHYREPFPSSLPYSFPSSLRELEQQQMNRHSYFHASASAPTLPLTTTSNALQRTTMAGVSPADLLSLPNAIMGSLNPTNTASVAGDTRLYGMLLPRGAGSGALSSSRPITTNLRVGLPEDQFTHQLSMAQPRSHALSARDIASGRASLAGGEDEASKKKRKPPSLAFSPPIKKRRRRRSRDPVVIAGVPHHTERDSVSLGIEEDSNWLSEFQCFVRSELMEVIKANQSDVLVRNTSKNIQPEQVGVRCRFCAHLSPGSRIGRSTAFPSSLHKLYQSFSMMVRDHFGRCSEVPADKAKVFQTFKRQNAQGATDSKQYWVYAAQKLGMIDAYSGIERPEASQAAALQMPPYGVTTTGEAIEGPTKPFLAPSESRRFTPFLFELMQHLQLVHLLPSERVGKRKGLPVGLEGLGCKYCCRKGRLGFSRCFPLRRRALPLHVYDLYRHCLRCPLCPDQVKQQLQQAHDGTIDSSDNAPKELESYAIIWTKLGRHRDLTSS